MSAIAILVSPLAKGAYFNDYLEVAQAELHAALPQQPASYRRFGMLDFLLVDVPDKALPRLTELSFVQGLFRLEGESLTPLPLSPDFKLHDNFVYGSKFKGKTNELLTQLLINIGLQQLGNHERSTVKLLDPMCGRATTLLWAMRYGLDAYGIERDAKALDDVRQIIKKWCKVQRQKHQLKEGVIGKTNRKGAGRFIDFNAEGSRMRMVTGDAADSDRLFKQKFDLIVSDLPYGIQHNGSDGRYNPLEMIKGCAPAWYRSLKQNGVMVLAFNSYQPKRQALLDALTGQGLEAMPFSAPHRMSESIIRDIVVLQKR